MSFSLARLSLYGFISSLDADLRDVIRIQIAREKSAADVISADLTRKLKERAERDKDGSADILDYLDFGDSLSILSGHRHDLDSRTTAFLQTNATFLESLIPIRNRVMHARPLHYSDVASIDNIAKIVRESPGQLFPRASEFEARVRADPYFPFSIDVAELHALRETNHNLPIPDFDETGFLGRTEEAKQLLQVCKGPWPLVTVIGEGGFGKTALALQVAYELLDDPQNPFEAVVWTTSKTTRLALNDIEQIEGAITSSLGIFQDISNTLGVKNAENPLEEVKQYLNSFKILLIIDNLETVLDETMLQFFASLNGSSKILVTSRVGTGVMNYPFPLGALSDQDSVQLLRATARSRRVPEITRVKTDVLRSYCRRMKNNPGFIKWFVSVVQCGTRPDQALIEPKIFLDFCLSNVYSHLSAEAKEIAKAMLAVPGKHAQPTLAYLTGMHDDQFHVALQSLWSSNLVSMKNVPTETGYETAYELNELPRLYILRNHGPSSSEVAKYQAKRREIMRMHERLQADQNKDRYDERYISRRTIDDTILAKYLADAILVSRRDMGQAFELVERAKRLDPSYFEVHRVEAFLRKWDGNYAAALESYETAIGCEQSSAPLRYWFGGFLLRDSMDVAAAQEQFIRARSLDPASVQITLELGRTYLFQESFPAADTLIESVVRETKAAMHVRRKAFDCWLQSTLRNGNLLYQQGEYVRSLESFEDQFRRYEEFSSILDDERIHTTMRNAIASIELIVDQLKHTDLDARAQECCHKFRGISKYFEVPVGRIHDVLPPESSDEGRIKVGYIARYTKVKHFGFIRFDENREIFFHDSEFDNSSRETVHVSQRVSFLVAFADGRFRATEIKRVEEASEGVTEAVGDNVPVTHVGIVKLVVEGKNFGFIYGDGESELFFHENYLEPGLRLTSLVPGTRVRYRLGANLQGVAARDIKLEH